MSSTAGSAITYDIAKIKLHTGKVFPNGPLRITYDYFEHSGDGDFFSVDSLLTVALVSKLFPTTPLVLVDRLLAAGTILSTSVTVTSVP